MRRSKGRDEVVDWTWSRDGQSIVCVEVPSPGGRVRIEIIQVHTGHKASSDIVTPIMMLPGFQVAQLSAYGECISVTETVDGGIGFQALIYTNSGKYFAFAPGKEDEIDAHSSLPVWHPEQPIVAYFQQGCLMVHDVISNALRFLVDLPGSYWRFGGCSVDCWSPCGDLLCFHTWNDVAKPQGAGTLVVVQSDGLGERMVFKSSYQDFALAVLSDASTGLLSIWTERKLHTLQGSAGTETNISLYKMSARSRIFSRSMLHKVDIEELPSHHTTFLFDGPLMALTAALPGECARLQGLVHNLAPDACAEKPPVAKTRLFDMRSLKEICVIDDDFFSAAPYGLCSLDGCSPTGDKLFMTDSVGSQAPSLKSLQCARLYSF